MAEFQEGDIRDVEETVAILGEEQLVMRIVWCERIRLDHRTDQYVASWEEASGHCRLVAVVAEVVDPVGEDADRNSMCVLHDSSQVDVPRLDMVEHKIPALVVLDSDELGGTVGVVLNPSHSCRDDW